MSQEVKTSVIADPQEKTAAALGAFLFFIPHFMNKKTEFVTLYMRQNFGIWIAYIPLQIFLKIFVGFMVSNGDAVVEATNSMSTRTGGFLLFVLNVFIIVITLTLLGLFVLSIYLIVKAYK